MPFENSAFDRMWADLAPLGRHAATGGYRRYAWTREDAVLREWFRGEAEQRGLDVVTDRAGNLWAWTADPDAARPGPRRRQPPGLRARRRRLRRPARGRVGVRRPRPARPGRTLRRPVGIACFADEEGARFGVACAGSRLLTGALDPDRARALTDDDGTTMAEAMTAAGHDPAALGRDDEALRRIGTFLELHVEQGRAARRTRSGSPPRSGRTAAGGWTSAGRADHAGHDPAGRPRRPDARAGRRGPGRPGRGRAARHGRHRRQGAGPAERGERHPVGGDRLARRPRPRRGRRPRPSSPTSGTAAGTAPVEESWTASTDFDAALRDRLATLLAAPVLPTGAGHDAGILSAAGIPTAMLFVRNPTGVSHSPAEHAEEADCQAGVTALARAIEALA